MAFDAFFLSAVLEEVRTRCIGARVEKIHQPARDTVIVHLRCQEGREKLLFAANPAAPRLHLTAASPENPAQPPMFCMLLRKHLLGAKLTEVSQPPMERAASFRFDCTDEMGFPVQKTLVAELMGRTCNLYLLSPEGRILDCLRRIGLDESAKRAALPGLMYQPPEPVMKLNLLDDAPEGDVQRYVNLLAAPGADVLADRLMDTVGGLSPLVCREAALYAAGSTNARIDSLDVDTTADKLSLFFHEHLSHPAPYYYALPDGTPKQFAFCPIREYGECRRAESFGKLLDMYYTVRDQKDAMRQKGQAVRKTVQNLCSRLTKKLAIQEKELEATYDRERLRQLGDILTANLHRIVKGQATVQCEDFYDEEMRPVDIPISPILSPNQNAAKYYKRYTKAKTAEKHLREQIDKAIGERDYLESVQGEIALAQTEAEFAELRRELQETGYLRRSGKEKKGREKPIAPREFRSSSGLRILVGRSNVQNDALTRKADKRDLWLHTQKIHGSHVILCTEDGAYDDESLHEAALLAAYYSQAQDGSNVPVDYTSVKYVKKPAGARPGMVVYETYRTLYVTPDEEAIRRLNRKNK